MFIDQWNSGGSAFVYWVFTTKQAPVDSGAKYHDTSMSAPSAII